MSKKRLNKTKLDLELIDEEINGCIISIIGLLLFIISANEDRQIILQKAMGNNTSSLPDPAKTALKGSEFIFLASIILANISFTKLNEKKKQIRPNESTSSLGPNIIITKSSLLSVTSNFLNLVAAEQKANESGNQITLI